MNRIYALAIAVILAIASAVWFIQHPAKHEVQDQALFDDLGAFANKVNSIEIENAQGVVFSAQKYANEWQGSIAEHLPRYPISHEKLAQLVTTLVKVKLIEPKTSKVKNYSRLGLQDIANPDSLASLVTIKSNQREWSVLVGNDVSFADGSYVRLPKNKQSWRTNQSIELPLDKYSWLKQPIFSFDTEDIKAISRIDQPNWQMVKQEPGTFLLSSMPADRTLEYHGVLDAMARSLVELNFEQLYVSEEIISSSLSVLSELEIEKVNGEIIRLLVSDMDGKHLVSIPTESPTEYWHNWHYQISNFSAQQLIKTVEDFLAEKSEPAADDTIGKAKTVEEGESPN